MLAPWKESYDIPRQHIKNQKHHFTDKGVYSQSYGFPSSHVWMWELNHKEDWMLKNWCFWIVVLEQNFENPLDSKKIKPVNPKGNQSWIFTGRTVAETEAPVLWPSESKSWLIGKDLEAGKGWSQKEKGWQRMRWLDSIINSIDMNLSNLWDIVQDRGAWHAAVNGAAKSLVWLSDWTTTTTTNFL